MAQKKKTAPSGGKKNTKKTAAKKPAQPKLTAAERREQKEEAIREATVSQRVGAEVLGVVLIALGVLLGLYLYRATEAPLGVALQKVLFGAVGVVAFGLPPFLLLLGIFSIAGRKRMPASGRLLVCVLLVVFVAALTQLFTNYSARDAEGKAIPIAKFIVDCFDRAVHAISAPEKVGGGVIGGLLCYVLELIGGRTLCGVVVVAGIVVCLLFITRISLKTFPELLKNKMVETIERLDAEADDEDYDEIASEYNAMPARKQKSLFIQSVKDEEEPVPEVDPDQLGHLENIPLPGGKIRIREAAEPAPAPKKKGKVPFDEAFFVPEAEEPKKHVQDREDLSFFPSGGPLTKKTKTSGPAFTEEPVDDVLRLPGDGPLPANKPVPDLTPELPKEDLFKMPPRRSKLSRVAEEPKAPAAEPTPLEDVSIFGQETAEEAPAAPVVRPKDPKNMTMDDL